MEHLNCFICGLNPITRADLDALCVSCRFAVSDGLYKIHHGPRCRIVEFATAAEHPLGTEFPNHCDPIEYRPELAAKYWRELDRMTAIAAAIEATGGL